MYPSAGDTIAYDPATGDELWRVRHGGMNASSRPLVGHGRIYLNTAAGGFKLFALKTGGSGDVTQATSIGSAAREPRPVRRSC